MIMKVDISWDELDNDTVLTEEEHTEKQPTAPNNEKSETQHRATAGGPLAGSAGGVEAGAEGGGVRAGHFSRAH